jgi:hypothetical protein
MPELKLFEQHYAGARQRAIGAAALSHIFQKLMVIGIEIALIEAVDHKAMEMP